jgi:hypothetical protein
MFFIKKDLTDSQHLFAFIFTTPVDLNFGKTGTRRRGRALPDLIGRLMYYLYSLQVGRTAQLKEAIHGSGRPGAIAGRNPVETAFNSLK